MGKRHSAYAIDFVVLHLILGKAVFSWSGLVPLLKDRLDGTAYTLSAVGLLALWRLVFLFKDGFQGCSPGKWALDLCVVDEKTGTPIGFGKSFKRNLVLVVPVIGEMIVWTCLHFGTRPFDGWAKCRVIHTQPGRSG